MALEHSAEVDAIVGGIDEWIARRLRSDPKCRARYDVCLELELALDPQLGGGFGTIASYLLMMAMLMVRPYGMFGQPPAERV